jgi:hypothetical protein
METRPVDLSDANENLDEFFKKVGEIGRYQFFIFFVIGLTATVPAISTYQEIFTAATPEFR